MTSTQSYRTQDTPTDIIRTSGTYNSNTTRSANTWFGDAQSHASDHPPQEENDTIIAICTDLSRCGSAIYEESIIKLIADRRDSGDPYKGLDMVLQQVDPKVVVISAAQKRLHEYIEKRFNFELIDLTGQSNNQNCANPIPVTDSSDPMQQDLTTNDGSTECYTSSRSDTHQSMAGLMSDLNFKLVIVSNAWFSLRNGLERLVESECVANKGFKEREEKLMFVSTRVKKSVDVCAIRSIAAIERYLHYVESKEPDMNQIVHVQRSQAASIGVSQVSTISGLQKSQSAAHTQTQATEAAAVVEQPHTNLMPILDIKYIDPGPILSTDKFTLDSLGIFTPRSLRNNNFKRGERDLNDQDVLPSLYDVLNLCTSAQGKRHLKTMLMWPLQNVIEISNRLDTVEYFTKPENNLLRDQLEVHLKNVFPIASTLTKLSMSVGTHKDFVAVYKSLWSLTSIIEILKSTPDGQTGLFKKIVDLESMELKMIVDEIVKIVDFESSRKDKRVQVHYGVDKRVDEKKEIVKNLAQFVDEVAIQETARYKNTLAKTFKVLYVPRIGFLSGVDYHSTATLLAIKMNPEFDVLLHTETSVYFKTSRMHELDGAAGDIVCDLIDIQEDVILGLQNELLQQTDLVLKLTDLCGELDCLIAFATVALTKGYTKPEFIEHDEPLEIRQAYHPVLSIRQNIVPNDAWFYKEACQRSSKIMIITGPNSCGKSTYMKAICLVIYMAHVGSFVPALFARIPLIDAILTKMHSVSSISTGMSSFASELHQIDYAIKRSTHRSLIVIDEFGEGTLAEDGFALLKGLVKYFADKLQNSPYLIVATHFNRLINHLDQYGEYLMYKTFKITRDPCQISYIYDYRMVDGVGEVTLADDVAARAGVPARIIDRAKEIRASLIGNRPITVRPPRGA